jgi:hypothetical protein
MRLPRMTTRRWMIVVAMIGVALGGLEVLRRRREYDLAMAAHHNALFDNAMNPPRVIKDFRPLAEYTDYHLKLMGKWIKAARSPWLPVEPDPPEPEWDFRRAFEEIKVQWPPRKGSGSTEQQPDTQDRAMKADERKDTTGRPKTKAFEG